jgi:hypothetical protein
VKREGALLESQGVARAVRESRSRGRVGKRDGVMGSLRLVTFAILELTPFAVDASGRLSCKIL